MKLSLILQAIDRASTPISKVAGASRKLGSDASTASPKVSRLGDELDETSREAGKAARTLDRVGGEIASVDRRSNRATGGLNRMLRTIRVLSRRPSLLIVRGQIDQAGMARVQRSAERWGGRIGRGFGIAAGLGIAAALALPGLFVRAVIDAGMEFDKGFATKVNTATAKLSGQWTAFLIKIGQAGVFDLIISKLTQLSAWVDRMAANGSLDRWAKQIAGAIGDLVGWIASVKWSAVAKDVLSIATAIAAIVGAVSALGGGGLSGLFNVAIVAIIGKMAFGLYGLAAALGVVSIAGAPLWLVVGVIAAIAAGAFLVWRNWDSITKALATAWEWVKGKIAGAVEAILGVLTGLWGRAKAAFSAGVSLLWNSLPAWFRGILTGASFVVRTVASAVAPTPNAPVQGGGRARPAVTSSARSTQTERIVASLDRNTKVDANFHFAGPGARGLRVDAIKPASPNTRVTVSLGRAMDGFA